MCIVIYSIIIHYLPLPSKTVFAIFFYMLFSLMNVINGVSVSQHVPIAADLFLR